MDVVRKERIRRPQRARQTTFLAKNITDHFNFVFFAEVYFPFKEKKFLELLASSNAYVCDGSVLQAIVDSPFYEIGPDESRDVDIYVKLDHLDKDDNIFYYLQQSYTLYELYQPTPYDDEFENHILQSLKFQCISSDGKRAILINLFIVKNSTNLVKLLSDQDLSCSETWLNVNPNLSFSVYSTSIKSIQKSECKLNSKSIEKLVNETDKKLRNKLNYYTRDGFEIIIPSTSSPFIYQTFNLEKYQNFEKIYFEILVNYFNTKSFFDY